MGVSAEDRIDPAHPRRQLQVNIHSVVRQQHDDLGPFGPHLVHHLLHVLVLDAEGPVGHEIARIGHRCVGKRLANDGAGDAIDFAHNVGFENRVTEIIGPDVLCDELHLALEVLVNDFLDPFHAVGELPVAGHHVHRQQLGGVHHVLGVRPQRSGRPLPGVAPIQQQRTRTAGLELFHQCGEVGKSADLAVTPCRLFKIEIGERIGQVGRRPRPGQLEEVLPHQVRKPPLHGADTDIDAGFAKVDRLELRVAIGHVKKGHIAERRKIVEALLSRGRVGVRIASQTHAGRRGRAHDLQEFAL